MIGILQPIVHNKYYLYTNLVNNIELWEMFNHLPFLLHLEEAIYLPLIPRHFQNNSIFYFNEDSKQLW